jgi:hypothetical protein
MTTNQAQTKAEIGTAQDSNVSLTSLEANVLSACLNYDNIQNQLGDNYSNCDLRDAHKICGGKHQASGVIGSLCKKGLIYDPMQEENKIIFMTEEGVRAIFAHIANNS